MFSWNSLNNLKMREFHCMRLSIWSWNPKDRSMIVRLSTKFDSTDERIRSVDERWEMVLWWFCHDTNKSQSPTFDLNARVSSNLSASSPTNKYFDQLFFLSLTRRVFDVKRRRRKMDIHDQVMMMRLFVLSSVFRFCFDLRENAMIMPLDGRWVGGREWDKNIWGLISLSDEMIWFGEETELWLTASDCGSLLYCIVEKRR